MEGMGGEKEKNSPNILNNTAIFPPLNSSGISATAVIRYKTQKAKRVFSYVQVFIYLSVELAQTSRA